MLKKIKKEWKQKKQTRWSNIKNWKENFRENYDSRFPTPIMDKSTDHLIEKNQTEAVSQSMKITKQILKFWLIWLAIVVLWYMMYISLSYIYMVIAWFIISLALEWCIVFRQRLTKSRWLWILITYLIAVIFILSWFIILVPFFFNRWNELLQSLMTRLLGIESSINQLWLNWFIEQINWLPWFMKEQVIERLQNSNTDNLMIIIRDNIGSIMSTSSGYLKVIAWQALSIFW
jgi:predicted PurR-regulated permease PerM